MEADLGHPTHVRGRNLTSCPKSSVAEITEHDIRQSQNEVEAGSATSMPAAEEEAEHHTNNSAMTERQEGSEEASVESAESAEKREQMLVQVYGSEIE